MALCFLFIYLYFLYSKKKQIIEWVQVRHNAGKHSVFFLNAWKWKELNPGGVSDAFPDLPMLQIHF